MDRTTVLQRVSTASASVIVAVFGLTGFAAAHGALSTDGPNSGVAAFSNTKELCEIANKTNINATNSLRQYASTGDVTVVNNTNVGNWDGWLALNPETYQADGISYGSWHDDLMTWLSVRDGGAGWNSSHDQLTWKPANAAWGSLDPLHWQSNGQSFDNWSAHTMSHLNGNFAKWQAGWPADATGMSSGLNGVSSGNASNNSSFSMNISVNNAPSSTGGLQACLQIAAGHDKPKPGGGKGGGQDVKKPSKQVLGAAVSAKGGGGIGGAGFGGFGGGLGTATVSQPHVSGAVSGPSVSTPKTPTTQKPTPTSPSPSISTSGPNSPIKSVSAAKAVTTVSNTTTINVTNNTTQSASTGSVTTVNNTSVGSSSGDSGNSSSGSLSASVGS